jgi:hypothetical protein
MATIERFQERVRRAVHDALPKVLAEGDLPDTQEGEARLTTIETLALAAGDAVSLEVFELQLAESGKWHGAAALPALRLRGTACQTAGSHAANAPGLGGAAEGARVLLPRLSPGFFSLGPEFWGWTWTMTTVQRP